MINGDMSLQSYFEEGNWQEESSLQLCEATSKHLIQVLRKKVGDQFILTNGKGVEAKATIKDDHRKHAEVTLHDIVFVPAPTFKNTIAISPLKNTTRFEWFLEKSVELGINRIVPLDCDHTEKSKLKTDRLQQIITSAMLQSQQYWLPELAPIVGLEKFLKSATEPYKLIAHCEEDDGKLPLKGFDFPIPGEKLLLIGPEGDFSSREIQMAKAAGFLPVSLGDTRLRTETAGVVGAVLLQG